MSEPIAPWRATYTPGQWVVLAGPTSLVVLQPAPARASDLLNRFWDDVLQAGSVHDLASTAVKHGLGELKGFGLLFWDSEGLHSLTRGDVRIVDADSGDLLASGEGVVTWNETFLGSSDVCIELEPVDEESVLHLPLLVGGATASSVLISTRPDSLVHSTQEPPAMAEPPMEAAEPLPALPPDDDRRVIDTGYADGVTVLPKTDDAMSRDAFGESSEDDGADLMPPVVAPVVAPVLGAGVVPPVVVPELAGDLGPVERDLLADEDEGEHTQVDADPFSDDEATGDIQDAEVVEPEPQLVDPPFSEEAEPAAVEPDVLVPPPLLDEPDDEPAPFVPEPEAQEPDPEPEPYQPPVQAVPVMPPPVAAPAPPMQGQPPGGFVQAPPLQQGGNLISATVCALGHANPPGALNCRVCGGPVGNIARLVPPPTLAVVRSSFGVVLDLTSTVLVGRAPDTRGDTSTQVLKVPSPNTDISRSHLQITPKDWQVEVTDLNSTNGSILAVPGRPPVKLPGGQPTVVPIGTIVDLGDGVQVRIDPPR